MAFAVAFAPDFAARFARPLPLTRLPLTRFPLARLAFGALLRTFGESAGDREAPELAGDLADLAEDAGEALPEDAGDFPAKRCAAAFGLGVFTAVLG